MPDLEQLNIKITGAADKAVSALDKLIEKLKEVQATMSTLSAAGAIKISVRDGAREIDESVKAQKAAFAEAKRDVVSYYRALEKYAKTDNDVFLNNGHYFSESGMWDDLAHKLNVVTDRYKDLDLVREELSDEQNAALDKADIEAYQNYAVVVDQVTSKVPNLKLVVKANEEIAESLEGVTAEAGNMQAAAEEISSASNALEGVSTEESVVSEVTHDTAEAIAEVGKEAEATKPSLKSLGDTAKRTEGGFGKLLGTIRRVATMRLIRWALRQLVNAAKEGIEILVEWDRTYGNNTSFAAKTVDELSAKWREVKKAAGAAFMPLIQIVQPVLNALMNGVISILNLFNQILRSVQGYSDYMKSTYTMTKNTVGAAKELRRILFGFDELNVLPSQNGSGGGISVSPIEFEPTGIAEEWIALGKTIRKVWEDLKASLEPLFENLKSGFEGLTKIIKGLILGDWSLIWEGLKQNVKACVDFIINLFKGGLEFAGKLFEPVYRWVYDNVIQPVSNAFSTAINFVSDKVDAAWSGIKGVFSTIVHFVEKNIILPIATALDNFVQDLPTGIKKFFGIDGEALHDYVVNLKIKTDTWISPDTQKIIDLLKKAGTTVLDIGASVALSARGYASGGSPEMGTFFYAGEHGAEVVANTSGGTGVMNVKQMQDAVSNGNVQVVNAIGAMANRVVGAINSKDTNAYLDGQKITDTVIRRANGMARATGQPVIAR